MKLFKFIFYFILFSSILFFYTKNINIFNKPKEIKNPNKLDVIVNKRNYLNKNFIPDNLVLVDIKYSNGIKFMNKEAYDNFSKMNKDINYKLKITSAYRSYLYQERLYNYYVKIYGLDYANKVSAKPGFSEHQTGLAIDIEGSNTDYNKFEESLEFDFVKNNSYKYGFILRYPKDKENITGFKYEPWHYRYVGIKLATYLYENNLTLDEYKKR